MRNFVFLFILTVVFFSHKAHGQDFYVDEPNLNYFNSGTLLFGIHLNKFEPLFEQINYHVLDETGIYDLSGDIYTDSTNFVGRSTYFGLGFNVNGIQFLSSAAFRSTSASNYYQLGFGFGFNHIIHYSYKTGQPLVWIEGLINYNYLKHNTRLKYHETNLFPLMVIDGTPFPDIGQNIEGEYRLNIEFSKHMIEPIAALNFALTKSIGLRFAAAYSLFLNGSNSDLFLRFKPNTEDNSGAKSEKMPFNRNIDNLKIDGKALTANHFEVRNWNFNISLVFRLVDSEN